MSPSFSGGGFGIEVVDVDSQNDLIRVFAEYRVVPKRNPWPESGVSDYILERRGEKVGGRKHAVGAQTRKSLIRKLGIDSDTECERVREEIKHHSAWGGKA